MPSISDLKKPANPQELIGDPIADAATAAMLRKEHQELARINAVLSQDFSTKLGTPRAPVREITVETPHIARMMHAQAAEARKQAEEAARPWWKRWGFWNTGVAKVATSILFVIGVWTFIVEVILK